MPIALTDATAPLTAGTTNVDNSFGSVTIDGGIGDDRLTGGSVHGVAITGAGGDDTITVNANSLGTGDGGPGADSLLGTPAPTACRARRRRPDHQPRQLLHQRIA